MTELGKRKPDSVRENRAQSLDAKKVSLMLYMSFRFSQGDPQTQTRLFAWIHKKFPNYKINGDLQDEVREIVKRRSEAMILNHLGARHAEHLVGTEPIAKETISDSVDVQLSQLSLLLNNEGFQSADYNEMSLDELFGLILEGMINSDLKFLEEGRVRKMEYVKSKPETDPRSSYLIDYGFKRANTGVPEYDIFFKDLMQYIKNKIANGDNEVKVKLQKIMEKYNSFHPLEQPLAIDNFE